MPIDHIYVLFKAKPDAAPEKLEAMLDALLGLKGRIAGILEASAGVNFSARAQGYTHGFLVRFTDRAALDVYQPHPAHQEVIAAHVRPQHRGRAGPGLRGPLKKKKFLLPAPSWPPPRRRATAFPARSPRGPPRPLWPRARPRPVFPRRP